MLEDVIKTKKVCGKTVSVLKYSIAKEDRDKNEPHNHYYEVRVSLNDKGHNFYTDSEFYQKKSALQIFNQVCKEIEIETIEAQSIELKRQEREIEDNKALTVLDSVTGKTFLFANSKDKRKFFDTWDKLVVNVLDEEIEDDIWYYPEDLGMDKVLNVFTVEDRLGCETKQINEYRLPKNWKQIVTQDRGKDGKPSIHDIMELIT